MTTEKNYRNRPSGPANPRGTVVTPTPPAFGTGTLVTGGQPPGSVVTNLPGVGMLRAGLASEVNGRIGSPGTIGMARA